MFLYFLAWRLNATAEEIERLFRIYKMIQNKSLQNLCENIAIAEEIGIVGRQILRYGYLLHNLPRYPKTTLKELSNIAGSDLKKAMRHYPKLIMISPRNYVKIYGILKVGIIIKNECIFVDYKLHFRNMVYLMRQ